MYLSSLSELAFGSRLKALSDHFYLAADEVYRACGADIESRWFPVLRYLWESGPSAVGDVAAAIGQTHSAVSQLADKLEKQDMVRRLRDPDDGRRSVLALTDKAVKALGTLGPIWSAIRRGVVASLGEEGTRLLATLAACEKALAERPIVPAILSEYAQLNEAPVEIVAYQPELAPDFYRLNAHWLQKYFQIEDIDREMLGNPGRYVIEPGGAVFFARKGGEVVGTVALLRESPGVYELSKMCVDELFQGLGVGRKLLDAAIAEYHRRGGTTLFLESNSRLKTALNMYEKAGFVFQPAIRPGSHYARADVYMIYQPDAVRVA